MRIQKNDMVVVLSGAFKGKSGKVLATQPKEQTVTIEGLGKITRHIRPNQLNPKGGSKELHKSFPVSKVALVHPTDNKKTTRIGYQLDKAGNKVRVAKQANNKEIK